MAFIQLKNGVSVSNYEQSAKILLENHIKNIRKSGLHTSELHKAQYNYQAVIKDLNGNIKLLVYFSKKGNKVVLQGNKELQLYQKVYILIFGERLFDNDKTSFTEPEIYIGTDESGKGDYFGPLVIAAVYSDPSISKKLKEIGVRDSKELTDQSISIIASKIKKLEGCVFDVIVINPEKYNILYDKMRNLNKLLGWAHAKAIENVLNVKIAPEAISDKFGNEKYIHNSLQEKGKEIKLHQLTKAEKFTAVAAASILARDSFSKWFYRLKKQMNIQLPKGASQKVEEKAKYIKKQLGDEVLGKLVKLHFKTTKKL
ncbi:MAG: ribonuclease HIII [Ignavibacteriaceae bacterium]